MIRNPHGGPEQLSGSSPSQHEVMIVTATIFELNIQVADVIPDGARNRKIKGRARYRFSLAGRYLIFICFEKISCRNRNKVRQAICRAQTLQG